MPINNTAMFSLKTFDLTTIIHSISAKDSSASSSQPEIITVPERIVTVTAKDLGSPASTVSLGMEGTKVSPPLVSYHSASHKLRDDKGSLEEEKQKSLGINVFPNKPLLLCVCSTSLLKTL